MGKIQKCFVTKRHIRRIVKKELMEHLASNQHLHKICDCSQHLRYLHYNQYKKKTMINLQKISLR